MTAALADPVADVAKDEVRSCDCRHIVGYRELVICPNPAAWVYRMRCCAGSTFVCADCRRFHIAARRFNFRCRWCETRGTISELVLLVRRLQ